MEYCEGGDLFHQLLKEKYFNEHAVALIMYKIISAVKHMHIKNIIHRDLKLENILFS